jgi:two-component system LytT family response regulator
MTILILENDQQTVEIVKGISRDFFPGCQIVEIAIKIEDARQLLFQLLPDILIIGTHQLSQLDFDLAWLELPEEMIVIWIGNDKIFSKKNIKFDSLTHLEKPVKLEELTKSLQHAKEILKQRKYVGKTALRLNQVYEGSILLAGNDGIYPLNLKDIIKIKSDGAYSIFFTTENKRTTITKNLGHFDKILTEYFFYRIHNTCLANIRHLSSYLPGAYPAVWFKDSTQERISRGKRQQILKILLSSKASLG